MTVARVAPLCYMLLLLFGTVTSFKSISSIYTSTKSVGCNKPHIFHGSNIRSSSSTSLALATGPIEIISPSYNLALGSLVLGTAFVIPGSPLKTGLSSILGGIPLLLFALFLAYQTTTLRFTFDNMNFSLVRNNLDSTGENFVVGGANVWAYDKIVNYDLFPSRSFPILVYFKETQTPAEFWNIGPGQRANSPQAIEKGAVPGQVHFFPAIANTEDIMKAFEKYGCGKL